MLVSSKYAGRGIGACYGAPQQFHSRKVPNPCQGDFGALHKAVGAALHKIIKM
jgi:hypothetical protein